MPYRIRAISDAGVNTATEALPGHSAVDDDGGWACRTTTSERTVPLAARDYGVIALAGLAGFTFAFWLACQ